MKINRKTSPRYVAPRRRLSEYDRLEREAFDQSRFAWSLLVCVATIIAVIVLRAVGV